MTTRKNPFRVVIELLNEGFFAFVLLITTTILQFDRDKKEKKQLMNLKNGVQLKILSV